MKEVLTEKPSGAERKSPSGDLAYRTILNSIGEAVITLDETGTVEFLNSEAERMFGYSNEEISGQKVHRLISEVHSEGRKFITRLKEGVGKEKLNEDNFQIEAQHASGTLFPVRVKLRDFPGQKIR